MKRDKAIVFCGQSGFPHLQTATIHRINAFCKVYSRTRDVYVLNRHPLKSNTASFQSKFATIAGHIGTVRNENFILRNLIKLASPLVELYQLVKLRLNYQDLQIHIYTEHTALILFYGALSGLLRATAVHHYVELRSSFSGKLLQTLDRRIYDYLAPKIFLRHIAISTALEKFILRNSLGRKVSIKIVPPICSFSELSLQTCASKSAKKYFLFCGSSEYIETISIVIKAFQLSIGLVDFQLVLVVSGSRIEQIKDICSESPRIQIYSNLEYSSLIKLFSQAFALLIPLRNTEQDSSRFPQKICEYLASGRAVITSPVGDIEKYFTRNVNAFIASDCSAESFSEELIRAATDEALTEEIASSGYQIGLKHFNTDSINLENG